MKLVTTKVELEKLKAWLTAAPETLTSICEFNSRSWLRIDDGPTGRAPEQPYIWIEVADDPAVKE